jgi:hypothetical protein
MDVLTSRYYYFAGTDGWSFSLGFSPTRNRAEKDDEKYRIYKLAS